MNVWGGPWHRRKTMSVWGGPCHSFILSGICPRDSLDNGKCAAQQEWLCWEGFSSLRCGCGMSELTPPLLLSTGEKRFSVSLCQTTSVLLFRQWEWDAETHRGERGRTWTNPSAATEKGEERFPCRCWDSGADVTVMSSSWSVLRRCFMIFPSSHRNQQSMVCLRLRRCW